MVHEAQAKSRRTRASMPKRKTGCLTCKVRRVKCDETKPNCRRCEKFGCICDGYAPTPRRKNGPAQTRIIMPRIPVNFQPLFYEPPLTLFKDEREHRYFQLFCEKTAFQLSGYFDSTLWSCLVLQACQSNPSIRHAVVAIAALDTTLESARDHRRKERKGHPDLHHSFALMQYSKAIRQMRDAASTGKQDLRTTLIACLVIICFETWHGNSESAVAQVKTGLDLIEEWCLTHVGAKSHEVGFVSPRPAIIEDDLIHAFGRLDIQTMSFIDMRSAESHQHMKSYGLTGINSMPETFSTIKEARIYLELVMQRLLHFMASVTHEMNPRGCIQENSMTNLSDAVMAERAKHLTELERWHTAFQPLLNEVTASPRQEDYLGATALQLHYLATYFGVAGKMTKQSQLNRRKFMHLFEEQVVCARTILDHPYSTRETSLYTFDLQVIVPLYIVIWQCPYGPLRKEAIALLMARPRREGLWDGVLAGKMAEWIMTVEEEDIEGDWIPDDKRILSLDVSFNMHSRTAHLRCLKPAKHSDTVERKQKIIEW